MQLHVATWEAERHEALAQRYMAEGKTKKADRHTRRADWYRSLIG